MIGIIAPADVLEYAHWPAAAGRRDEVLRIVVAKQRSKLRGKLPDFDFRVRRAIASNEIEKERDTDIVDILKSRGIDDDRMVWITGERVDR